MSRTTDAKKSVMKKRRVSIRCCVNEAEEKEEEKKEEEESAGPRGRALLAKHCQFSCCILQNYNTE